ncbi:MAG: hypothetical protein ACTSU5_08205 [Promethearchaeota archaeon]
MIGDSKSLARIVVFWSSMLSLLAVGLWWTGYFHEYLAREARPLEGANTLGLLFGVSASALAFHEARRRDSRPWTLTCFAGVLAAGVGVVYVLSATGVLSVEGVDLPTPLLFSLAVGFYGIAVLGVLLVATLLYSCVGFTTSLKGVNPPPFRPRELLVLLLAIDLAALPFCTSAYHERVEEPRLRDYSGFTSAFNETRELEVASALAPVIVQHATTEEDYVTRVDFDGDMVSDNNWEHFEQNASKDLRAFVYYQSYETASHFLVWYHLYHAHDYDLTLGNEVGGHENDMEGLLVVARKHGPDPTSARVEFLYTLYHSIYQTAWSGFVLPRESPFSGEVVFEPGDAGRRHPVVFVEDQGHGIQVGRGSGLVRSSLSPHEVRYVYGNGTAGVPSGLDDEACPYGLLSTRAALWPYATWIGEGNFTDKPVKFWPDSEPVGVKMDGDDYSNDSAALPWAARVKDIDGSPRGEAFFDPAYLASVYALFPSGFSRTYAYNPYCAGQVFPEKHPDVRGYLADALYLGLVPTAAACGLFWILRKRSRRGGAPSIETGDLDHPA